MNDHDKKLLSDEEWSELMQSHYEKQGRSVDDVAKARVWKRLERHSGAARPRRLVPWAALAAGLLAVVGVTQLMIQPPAWREKGRVNSIPVTLTPYLLAADGSTTPLNQAPAVGDTIIFRAYASEPGVYAVIIRENNQAPRIAIRDNQSLSRDEVLITKSGSIYGIDIESEFETIVCVIAMPDAAALAKQLEQPIILPIAASPGCAVLQAPKP